MSTTPTGWHQVEEEGFPKPPGIPGHPRYRSMIPYIVTLVDVDGELQSTMLLCDGMRWYELNPPLGMCKDEVIAWQPFPTPFIPAGYKRPGEKG